MSEPIRPDRSHDEAEELLPWYATGQLDQADQALVESHLSSCSRCRGQLKAEQLLITEFRSLTPEIDTSWSRLRARLEPDRLQRPNFGRILQDIWNVLSRPAVAALAVAQVAFMILAGTVLLSISRPGPAYRTLGAADVSRSANIIVIFRPDATEGDVRDALRSAGASLVGGPTAADAYLVHVPTNQRQAALARLQSDDNVEMAEPIDGASQ